MDSAVAPCNQFGLQHINIDSSVRRGGCFDITFDVKNIALDMNSKLLSRQAHTGRNISPSD